MFDFLNSGTLEKLKIESWAVAANRSKASEKTFTAFINPDEFTLNYSANSDARPTPGTTGSPATFISSPSLELALKFFLDGTKATGQELNVVDKIKEFYDATGYDGTKHRTRYLRIIWGKLALLRPNEFSLDCVLKSVSIQYKLFKADGTPLRAIINATFTEALTNEDREARDGHTSPDLTHVRVVKEGDTLPGMTYNIYGNFKYYLEVAKANNLKDFRNLYPGQKIFFPPFDKNVKVKSNA